MPYNAGIEGAMGSVPRISTQTSSSSRAVAPAWHTVVVLILLLGFSLVGALNPKLSPLGGPHSRACGYLVVMLFEGVIVGFIWYGIRRRGVRMADLVGGAWARPGQFFRDLGIAIAFLLVCGVGVLNGIGYLLKVSPNQAIRNMFPHGATEVALWLLMSVTAGFCEEVIFRGYFQRQFTALTQSVAGGIVFQSIAFGAAHGYQGWKYMVLIAIYGTMFGLLAQWRRSLRPGIITHFVQDGLGGLLARHLMR